MEKKQVFNKFFFGRLLIVLDKYHYNAPRPSLLILIESPRRVGPRILRPIDLWVRCRYSGYNVKVWWTKKYE